MGDALIGMRTVVMSFTRYYDDDVQDAEYCRDSDEDDVTATMTIIINNHYPNDEDDDYDHGHHGRAILCPPLQSRLPK